MVAPRDLTFLLFAIRSPWSCSGPSRWCGMKKVSSDDKKGMVRDVFSSVAHNYDVMNDLMSAGVCVMLLMHVSRTTTV